MESGDTNKLIKALGIPFALVTFFAFVWVCFSVYKSFLESRLLSFQIKQIKNEIEKTPQQNG